jgi:hypothetical protein
VEIKKPVGRVCALQKTQIPLRNFRIKNDYILSLTSLYSTTILPYMSADTRPSFRITGIRKIAAAAAISAAIAAGCGDVNFAKPTQEIKATPTPVTSMQPEKSNDQKNQDTRTFIILELISMGALATTLLLLSSGRRR